MAIHRTVMTPLVEDANVPLVIHKRHVIGLCTHRCNKLFFDFDKLYRERGVVLGGAWPNQWIALRTPRSTQKQRVVELPSERAPTPQVWVDDEAAIAEAIRQSLAIMPPSPQFKSGTREVAKIKEITTSIDGPIELCCPITLQLFRDPVKTLHGQTYERTAVEDWLESKSTDPMTGDILKIKALFPEDEMKHEATLRPVCSEHDEATRHPVVRARWPRWWPRRRARWPRGAQREGRIVSQSTKPVIRGKLKTTGRLRRD